MDAAYSYQLLRAREVNQRVRWARLLETRVRQDLDLLTPWLSAHGFLLLHIPRFSGSPARLHSEICPPDRGPTISIRNRHRLGHERPCPIAARRHFLRNQSRKRKTGAHGVNVKPRCSQRSAETFAFRADLRFAVRFAHAIDPRDQDSKRPALRGCGAGLPYRVRDSNPRDPRGSTSVSRRRLQPLMPTLRYAI